MEHPVSFGFSHHDCAWLFGSRYQRVKQFRNNFREQHQDVLLYLNNPMNAASWHDGLFIPHQANMSPRINYFIDCNAISVRNADRDIFFFFAALSIRFKCFSGIVMFTLIDFSFISTGMTAIVKSPCLCVFERT